MSFQEKNITVTLVVHIIIFFIFISDLLDMIQNGGLNSSDLFRLWGIIIFLTVAVTIIGMIITHIVSTIFVAIQTGDDDPDIEDFEDERDNLIDLRGTKTTHIIYSFGGFLAMLTFALGQSPLVMFSLLIFFGILAQIVGDVTRLVIYRRGF